MKGSCHFELACLKKENILASFWFDTSAMLFVPLGVLLVMMKTLEDECYVIMKAY